MRAALRSQMTCHVCFLLRQCLEAAAAGSKQHRVLFRPRPQLPLRLTSLRPGAAKSYVTVLLDVDGLGFRNFLVDSGTSGVLVTPALRDALGISPYDGAPVTGLQASCCRVC